ncbi:MAG TPA: hypothetical protein VF221_01565 [Chloroflexota bacterium]
MYWPTWVEHVFGRIAQRWRENEESQQAGVPLSVETLAPDLAARYPHNDLFAALVEAYVDPDWLGVVADPEIHNPTMIQATPLGQRAMANGLATVTLPHIQEKCDHLSSEQFKFLAVLVKAVQSRKPPIMPPHRIWFPVDQIARRALARTKTTEEDASLLDTITWELWGEGLIVRQGRDPVQEHGYPQMVVAPLYAGFACVRISDVSQGCRKGTR